MNYEEAIKKFGIAVPSDDVFYSPKYIEYFRKNKERNENSEDFDEELEEFRDFQKMYEKAIKLTFFVSDKNKGNSSLDRIAVVLGGQAGAGKSSIAIATKREFEESGKNIFIIDDDAYRSFYPRTDEILQECPELFTRITAIGSGRVTPKVLKYASDRGLNFIFDGTMKNTRILETASKWEDYDITYRLMATPRIESLISCCERNLNLRLLAARNPHDAKYNGGQARPITVEVHDGTYDGIEGTLDFLQTQENHGNIQLYTRGTEIGKPILRFDLAKAGPNEKASQALASLREEQMEQANLNDSIERLRFVRDNDEIVLNQQEKQDINKFILAVKKEYVEFGMKKAKEQMDLAQQHPKKYTSTKLQIPVHDDPSLDD